MFFCIVLNVIPVFLYILYFYIVKIITQAFIKFDTAEHSHDRSDFIHLYSFLKGPHYSNIFSQYTTYFTLDFHSLVFCLSCVSIPHQVILSCASLVLVFCYNWFLCCMCHICIGCFMSCDPEHCQLTSCHHRCVQLEAVLRRLISV